MKICPTKIKWLFVIGHLLTVYLDKELKYFGLVGCDNSVGRVIIEVQRYDCKKVN